MEGRGGEGRKGERRDGREGGREGRNDYYTYYSDGTIYSACLQTNNEELYLYNNDVTYYVITFKSAFD